MYWVALCIYLYLLYILKFAVTACAYRDTISMSDNGANCVLNAMHTTAKWYFPTMIIKILKLLKTPMILMGHSSKVSINHSFSPLPTSSCAAADASPSCQLSTHRLVCPSIRDDNSDSPSP